MKIVQLCSATEMGGGEVHVADLVRALARRGHELYLAVRPQSPLRDVLNDVPVNWHEIPLRNSLDLASSRSLTDLIETERIDIAHAHVGRDYLIAALACRRAPRCRLVLTRHHYLPLKSNPLYRWLLGDYVAAFIAVSDSVRDLLIERLAVEPERVRVIPNWIDSSRFQTIERHAARAMFGIEKPFAVVCIGQLTPEKGQEDFVRAAGQLAQRRSDVEFLIAGEEQDEYGSFTSRLKELVSLLGIRDRVRFLGFVDQIPELLAASDVVAVPSWNEGFSLVTIEAMAARRVVLAANVGGIAGIIRDNSNGLLFPPRDVKAMAEKLLWALADTELRERLAAQGSQDAMARYHRDRIIEQIETLYRELLEARQ